LLLKRIILIFCLPTILGFQPISGQQNHPQISILFCGDTVLLPIHQTMMVQEDDGFTSESVYRFFNQVNNSQYQPFIQSLLNYKQQNELEDWLFYQLIRYAAEAICSKQKNYQYYTLYKWFLLSKSGYASALSIKNDRLLFYVQSDENIMNIPYHFRNGKQYVCLNYHDYQEIDFTKEQFLPLLIDVPEATQSFSYRVKKLPSFKPESYSVKNVQFDYKQKAYYFKLMVNSQVEKFFTNYPVVDFESYFNVPMSNVTYTSLIPLLKEQVKKMSQAKGVDYLMHFTRYAFAFETDTKLYGKEKRLTPEQTLLNNFSDCEDRAALFFFLVKEIYNLPMIAIAYPTHVTVAVKFDTPLGKPITYNGQQYSVCEPTPQAKNLKIGQTIPALKHTFYEVVYAYNP